jgi:hypothetical protein
MTASRQFIDSFGFAWQVWEVPRLGGEARPQRSGSPGSLYFFCRGTTRVLTDYPALWEEDSWSELEELCARADVLGADQAVASPLGTATGVAPPAG